MKVNMKRSIEKATPISSSGWFITAQVLDILEAFDNEAEQVYDDNYPSDEISSEDDIDIDQESEQGGDHDNSGTFPPGSQG